MSGLRPFRWWDIESVLDIEQDVFEVDEPWSAEMFWSELAQRSTRHYVVTDQVVTDQVGAHPTGQVLGYAGLAYVDTEAWVQTIAVRRECWGSGLGSALLDDLLRVAGRRAVSLEVRADNERAQGLYARRGFTVVGRRRGYYQPSGADALVMQRAAS